MSEEEKQKFSVREFDLMDTNKNGQIDEKEFMAYVNLKFPDTDRELVLNIFSTMDRNKDKVLTREEFLFIFSHFEHMLGLKIMREEKNLQATKQRISNYEETIKELKEKKESNPTSADLQERYSFGVVSMTCKTAPSFQGVLQYKIGNQSKQLQFVRGEASEGRILIDNETTHLILSGINPTIIVMNDIPSSNEQIIDVAYSQDLKIKVTLKRQESERSQYEREKKQLQRTEAEQEAKLAEIQKQLDRLYDTGVDKKMLGLEIQKGAAPVRAGLPKNYKIWANSMYIVSLLHVLALTVQSVCFKSPIPDLLIIFYLLWVIDQMIGWENNRFILGAVIYLGVSVVFDIIWASVNSPMDHSNYYDGGDFRACRNATFYVVWLQVICKLLDIAGLFARKQMRISRE